jgi:hypothetical protein
MGYQQNGDASGANVLDQLPGIAPGLRIEAAGQLVEHRDLRVTDQRQRDRETLALTPGELAEGGVALLGKPEVVNQLLPVGRVVVERAVEIQRLLDHDLLGQLALLELDAKLLSQFGVVASRIETQHADRA